MSQKSLLSRPIIICLSIFTITFCANADNPGLEPAEHAIFQKYDTDLNSSPATTGTINAPTVSNPNTQMALNKFQEAANAQNLNHGHKQLLVELNIPLHSHDPQKPGQQMLKVPEKSNYREITDVELQRIISSLPEQDQQVILNIQKQISNWPDSVFKEVREYNEFMIMVNHKTKDKYIKLSNAARQALQTEQDLKKQLSGDAMKVLSKLNVR